MSSNSNNRRNATDHLSLRTFLNQIQRFASRIYRVIPCLRNNSDGSPMEEQIVDMATEEQTLEIFENELLLGKIVEFLPKPKDTQALAFTNSNNKWFLSKELSKNPVLVLKISNVILNCDRERREPIWMFGVHNHNSTTHYQWVPPLLLKRIKIFEVASHLTGVYRVGEEFQFMVKPLFTKRLIQMLCAAREIKVLKLQSFAISMNMAFIDSIPPTLWDHLEEIRIEDVYEYHDQHDQIIDFRLVMTLVAPFCLFSLVSKLKCIKKLILKSLFFTETALRPLRERLDEKNNGAAFLQKLHTLRLEDIIVPSMFDDYTNDLFWDIIERCPNKMNIALSVQHHTFGQSLFRKLVDSDIQFSNFHVILNLRIAETWIFDCIEKLHSHCDSITITFHRMENGETPFFEYGVTDYFKSWTKVTEVHLGKRIYAYGFNSIVPSNRDPYIDVLSHVILLPNLESFTLHDQVDEHVLSSVRSLISKKPLKELKIVLSQRSRTFDETHDFIIAFNELVKAIPDSVRYLTLKNVPLQHSTLILMAPKLDKHLKVLKYYKNDLYISNGMMKSYFSKTYVDTRFWMSEFYNGTLKYTISNWLDIHTEPPEIDLF